MSCDVMPTPCQLICLNHVVTADARQMHARLWHRVSSATCAAPRRRPLMHLHLISKRRKNWCFDSKQTFRAAALMASASRRLPRQTEWMIPSHIAVLHFHFFSVYMHARRTPHSRCHRLTAAFDKITAAIIIRAIISASPLSASSWVFSTSHHRHHRPLHYRHRRQQMICITIFSCLSHFLYPTPHW